MKNFFQRLKIKIRGDHITLPEYSNIAPLIYTVLAISGGIGISHTIALFSKKETITQSKIQTPSKRNDIAKNEYDAIIKRNIFNIDGTVPDSSDSNEKFCPAESRPSSLAYKVTGIIFGGDAKSSTVLLEQNSGNKQLVFKLGDNLLPGTVISDITQDRVYITSKNCPEYLALNYPELPSQKRIANKSGNSNVSYSENGFERVGNDTTVTKQWVNDILTNKLSSALEDARAIPYVVGGQVKGFSITQIVPDSVYSKLGLKNGDIVSSINGIELNDAARAIQTLNSLRSETKIELDITRDGQPVTLKVSIQ